jgi:Ca2+-binding RTX toxin-like protein
MPNVIMGTSKDDVLNGTSNEDLIYGLAGNDTINGGNGNDIITGGAASSLGDANNLSIKSSYKGQIVLDIPKVSALNPVGMYKIDGAGNISDVKILWGGDLVWSTGLGNQSVNKTLDVDLKAGERYGFFILSDGYVSTASISLFNNSKVKWELRDKDGGSAQVTDNGLRLWYTDPVTGLMVLMSVGQGHEIYHSIGGTGTGYKPNPDGKSHAKTSIDYAQGVVTIGLESGKGNNPDFKDAIIKFNMGIDNVLELGEPDPAGNGGDDVLSGGEGDDRILGMAGGDLLYGGNGQDRLWGNSGNDKLWGDGGDDWLSGGTGNDTISGGQGQDRLYGKTGNDALYGDDGDDQLWGDDGDDQLWGGNNNDTVYGGKGADRLWGEAGDDRLNGDTGNDVISGGDNNDQIKGGDGNDTVSGDNGDDNVSGGKGEDQIDGGAGNDTLKGDTGRDTVWGGDGDDKIWGGDGDDVLAGGNGIDQIFAGKGNDTVRGDAGNDQIKGDSGNDVIVAGSGDDIYDGGSGVDTIDFSEAAMGITVDLEAKSATGFGNDKVLSMENATGSAFSDTILGNKLANTLKGGAGDDVLTGARGSDTLWGGSGNDTFVWASRKDVTGETGTDGFVDTIKDLEGSDVLNLAGFKLNMAGGIDLAVMAVAEGANTALFAYFGDAGFVKFAVLEGVASYDVAAHYADGTLLV